MPEDFKSVEQEVVKKSTRFERAFFRRIIDLSTAAFGLVAALAWNDTITALVNKYIPAGSDFTAKLIYAVIVTILAVGFTMYLGRVSAKMNLDEERQNDAESKR